MLCSYAVSVARPNTIGESKTAGVKSTSGGGDENTTLNVPDDGMELIYPNSSHCGYSGNANSTWSPRASDRPEASTVADEPPLTSVRLVAGCISSPSPIWRFRPSYAYAAVIPRAST